MLEEAAASMAGGSSSTNNFDPDFQYTLTCKKCKVEKQVPFAMYGTYKDKNVFHCKMVKATCRLLKRLRCPPVEVEQHDDLDDLLLEIEALDEAVDASLEEFSTWNNID